jgi:hypothetical protein
MGLYETDRGGMTSLLGPSLSLVMKLGGGVPLDPHLSLPQPSG